MTHGPEDILHQDDVEAVVQQVVDTDQAADQAKAVSTTAALAAVGNAINTAGKVVGKMVFNTTTGKPVWAAGPLAADVWKDATGATAHTPV